MNPRIYNKLYVNKNRTEGSDKVLLGYRYNEREITFKKDTETYFHVPVYATSIELAKSSLIENGAIAGTFPAASDRIFKSQKNYGNVSPYGSPTANQFPSNGVWFCSWLKYNPFTNQVQWVDRFYHPGRFIYEQAERDLTIAQRYEVHDPAFQDIPTTLVFEPQVLYKYFHVGEQTSNNILTSFEGISGEFLGIHLKNWGTGEVDRSSHKIQTKITTNAPESELFSDETTETEVSSPTINFNNRYNIAAQAEWSSSYSLENEFTWSFWAHSENWQASTNTQLFGNYSVAGEGVGIFLESLQSYPFFVIPETTYGKLLYINEGVEVYLDKQISGTESALTSPACIAVTSEREVFICNEGQAGGIFKFDHIGNVLCATKNLNDRSKFFMFPNPDETAKQMLCGLNDSIHILTTHGYYNFDKNLTFLKSIPLNTTDVVLAFNYTASGEAVLNFVEDASDVKYVFSDEWLLKKSDGNLYKNGTLVFTFEDKATNLSVSPDNKLWIAHGSNNVTIFDISTGNTSTVTIGSSTIKQQRKKTINFFKQYIREKTKFVWNGLIVYSDEQNIYTCDLTGLVKTRTKLIDLLDYKQMQQQNQTEENATFNAVGDFTGYERDRVFNPCSPINNNPQLKLKVCYRDSAKAVPIFETLICSIPITDWTLNSWQHFSVILKNKTLELYINAQKKAEVTLKGNQRLTNLYQNAFFIGTENGHKFGLNKELNYTSRIFNGKIRDIRVFNYAFKPYDLKIFINASAVGEDLYWQVPMPMTQYVEQINRFFKNKLPGAKSQFFKIKLHGTQITDIVTQKLIEEELKRIISEQKPSYTDLLKFEWIS